MKTVHYQIAISIYMREVKTSEFRQHRIFSWDIIYKNGSDNWTLHVYDKNTGVERAKL